MEIDITYFNPTTPGYLIVHAFFARKSNSKALRYQLGWQEFLPRCNCMRQGWKHRKQRNEYMQK